MKLSFESWINSQSINREARELFEEAFVCYRASAYRATLLFSYLAFQMILRRRLLSADHPQAIDDEQWNQILDNLRDDDSWDPKVFETTQMKSPRNVFDISEDLRNQVVFWKNRRNDCAHSKSNAITFAHVEAFWQFIKSNLARFVVEGSMLGLLNEIEAHFDRSLTPIGADYTYLLEKVPRAVDQRELPQFFEDLLNIFDQRGDHIFGTYSQEEIRFFCDLLSVLSDQVLVALIAFLRRHVDLLVEILRVDPSMIHHFEDDPRFIRNLWYEHLFIRVGENFFPLYVSLFRNGLIPVEQNNEAHSRIIPRLSGLVPSDAEFEMLAKVGFLQSFQEYAFESANITNFNWANSNSRLIIEVLNRIEISQPVVNSLYTTFSVMNHPWDLRQDLNAHLQNNHELAESLRNGFQESGLPQLPRYLESLHLPPAEEEEIPF